jgi:predicted  nucleic acid-binding Zn-ribbon protein
MSHSGKHNKCPTCGNRLSIGIKKVNQDTGEPLLEPITIKSCPRCGWNNRPRTPEEIERANRAKKARQTAMNDKDPETPKNAKGTSGWRKKQIEKKRKKKYMEEQMKRLTPLVNI